MAAKQMFSSAEAKTLGILTLILAFAFGFRFSGPATIKTWFANFVLILVLVSLSVLIREMARKFAAKKFSATVETQMWYSGIVFMLLAIILSGGWLVFAVPWATTITRRAARPGSVFPGMGPRQNALIALAGSAANFGLVLLAKIFSQYLGAISEKLMWINASLAIANLLPLITLLPILAFQWTKKFDVLNMPRLDGDYVFFGQRILWVFAFSFVTIGCLALIFIESWFGSLLLAFIAAAAIWIAWHWFLEPPSIFGAKSEILPGMTSIKGPIVSWRKK